MILVKVVDDQGDSIEGAHVVSLGPNGEEMEPAGVNGSVAFLPISGGRHRGLAVRPDEPFTFRATAKGYGPAETTLTLPEGETREVTLVLKKN